MRVHSVRTLGVFSFLLGALAALAWGGPSPVLATDPCAAPVPDDTPVSAPPSAALTVRFSEVFPDPEGTDADAEYIEVENTGDVPVGAGAVIANASGKTFVLPEPIAPHGFAAYPYATTKLSLVNSGMTLALRDGAGTFIDSLSYGAAKTGMTYARRGDGTWDWTASPTPGTANAFAASPAPEVATPQEPASTPDAAPAPEPAAQEPAVQPAPTAAASVSISEFVPDPAGTDDAEWIELQNAGDVAAALDELRLDDGDGGSSPFTLKGLSVPAHGVLVVPKSVSKLSLNNDTDSVRLLDAAGAVLSSVSYANPPEGKSYAWYGGAWYWSAAPTPGEVNPPPPAGAAATIEAAGGVTGDGGGGTAGTLDNPTPATIEDLDAADDEYLELRTVVTLPPGIIGQRMFMVSNAGFSRGVVVRAYGQKPLPKLAPGDAVRLVGRAATAAGRPQFSVNGDGVTRVGGGTLSFATRDVSEVAEEDIGVALAIRGQVARRGASSIVITDAEAAKEVTVRVARPFKDAPAKGAIVTAKGVLRVRSDQYELMVAGEADVEAVEETHAAETSAATAQQDNPPSADPLAREKRGGSQALGRPMVLAGLGVTATGAAAYAARRRRNPAEEEEADEFPAADMAA